MRKPQTDHHRVELQHDKNEWLPIVLGIKSFRPYLVGMSFEVFKDHHSLQWLCHMKGKNVLMHRWIADLKEYDFVVHHRPGKSQGYVDGLSRLPRPLETVSLIEADAKAMRELKQVADNVRHAPYLTPGMKIIGGCLFNREGRVVLGPKAVSPLHARSSPCDRWAFGYKEITRHILGEIY